MATVPTLVKLSLSEMLLSLRSQRATGLLTSSHDRFLTRVYFIDGTIVAVASDDPAHDLATYLVREGILNPSLQAPALRLAERTGRPVDDILVKTGAANVDMLEAARGRHALEVLVAIDLDENPDSEFADDELPDDVSGDLALGVEDVLRERQRRRAATLRIRQHFDGRALTVSKLGRPAGDLDVVECRLLDLLEGPMSVEAACVKAGTGRWAALDGLARLAEKGAVEFAVANGRAQGLEREQAAGERPRRGREHAVDSADAWIGLGRGLIEKGRFEESLGAFRGAVAAEPHNSRARQILGQAEVLVCSILWQELPPDRPLCAAPEADAAARAALPALDAALLTLFGGGRDVKAVIKAAPVPEADVLLGVRRLLGQKLLAEVP